MSEICISSVCATVLQMLGVEIPEGIDAPNPAVTERVESAVLYNPDAIGWWLYEKYPQLFDLAEDCAGKGVRLRSVMPSVTPVCFASMYTGLMPEKHGIQAYVKPVLTVDTMFDYLLRAGKRVAIVSTEGDSISKIFLERNMDYFIYPTKRSVNRKAEQLIAAGRYDVLVIYNPDYDNAMHAHGPEDKRALRQLHENVKTFARFVALAQKQGKKTFCGFCPDHGCHEIDGKHGSHGLDMEEDMNVVHFYCTVKGE